MKVGMWLNPDNPEEQRIIDNVLAHMVFLAENEEIKGEYTYDQEALKKYCEALEICQKLKEKGKCDFKADDPRKKYEVHQLEITWELDKDFSYPQVTPPIESVKNLCEKMEIITMDKIQVWCFYQTIYTAVE